MCDNLWQRMEKSQGDLTDIFQGSGLADVAHTWQPSLDPEVALTSSTDCFSDEFGDTKDLMLHELAGSGFFGSTEKTVGMARTVIQQPSPSPPGPIVGRDYTEKVCGGAPIPSARTPVIKRRKNQATRKVVCIPAPAIASNKPGGEVVPSDLWAWRKYGQKPIKGSPYPRGYYRCSSSKGCSARKQVERSRTDPSMLVITYTSDHNHPWPTQKNALSSSSRSQSSKNNNNNASSSNSTHSSINQIVPPENITSREEEEDKECSIVEINEMEENINNCVDEQFHHDVSHIYELEPDDFFEDLAIIDAGSVSLDEEKNKSKDMDPSNVVCWDERNSL